MTNESKFRLIESAEKQKIHIGLFFLSMFFIGKYVYVYKYIIYLFIFVWCCHIVINIRTNHDNFVRQVAAIFLVKQVPMRKLPRKSVQMKMNLLLAIKIKLFAIFIYHCLFNILNRFLVTFLFLLQF